MVGGAPANGSTPYPQLIDAPKPVGPVFVLPPVDESPWELFASTAAGLAHYFGDRPDAAAEQMRRALHLCAQRTVLRSRKPLLPRDHAVGVLALIDLDAGDHDHAEALVAVTALAGGSPCPPTLLDVARARLCVGRGDLDEATARLETVAEGASDDPTRILALLDLAALRADCGEAEPAAAEFDRARHLLARNPRDAQLIERRIVLIERRLGLTPPIDEVLSSRERQVLELLDSPSSRREIAAQLYLSHNTIKTYVQRIYRRLDVSSRPDAIARARELGWL